MNNTPENPLSPELCTLPQLLICNNRILEIMHCTPFPERYGIAIAFSNNSYFMPGLMEIFGKGIYPERSYLILREKEIGYY